MATLANKLQHAATVIKRAQSLVITAGAGMGVDSGLPDFRGADGFWKAYPPMRRLGLQLPDMSNPQWFIDDPEFAWGFFGHRYHLYRKTVPHKGFQILLNWCKNINDNYFVFTSNVDGHFQKAGFDESKVVECHGSINFLQCLDGDRYPMIWPAPTDFEVDVDVKTFRAKPPLPHGPPLFNRSLARPNILMFSDWGFLEQRTSDQRLCFSQFKKSVLENKQKFAVVEIGAGYAVPTVRYEGQNLVQKYKNGTLIRINTRDPDVSDGHISLPMGGLEALQKIDELLKLESD